MIPNRYLIEPLTQLSKNYQRPPLAGKLEYCNH